VRGKITRREVRLRNTSPRSAIFHWRVGENHAADRFTSQLTIRIAGQTLEKSKKQ
jgi:hypothetical protein